MSLSPFALTFLWAVPPPLFLACRLTPPLACVLFEGERKDCAPKTTHTQTHAKQKTLATTQSSQLSIVSQKLSFSQKESNLKTSNTSTTVSQENSKQNNKNITKHIPSTTTIAFPPLYLSHITMQTNTESIASTPLAQQRRSNSSKKRRASGRSGALAEMTEDVSIGDAVFKKENCFSPTSAVPSSSATSSASSRSVVSSTSSNASLLRRKRSLGAKERGADGGQGAAAEEEEDGKEDKDTSVTSSTRHEEKAAINAAQSAISLLTTPATEKQITQNQSAQPQNFENGYEPSAPSTSVTRDGTSPPVVVVVPPPPTTTQMFLRIFIPFPNSIGQLRRRIRRFVAHVIATYSFVGNNLVRFVEVFGLARVGSEEIFAPGSVDELSDVVGTGVGSVVD